MKTKITLIGDIALNGLFSCEPHFNRKRFIDIAKILNNESLVFANLEIPIKASDEFNEYKNYNHFSIKEPVKEILSYLNIGCVSLANNHVYDCKRSGLSATINMLDELGIRHTGAGLRNEDIEPVFIDKEYKRICFLAYVDKSTNPHTEKFKDIFINYFDVNKVIEEIRRIKDKADLIICSIHWGKDYSHYYTKIQQQFAHKIIDAGAHVIMGHHPHTIQPFEIYNSKAIFYSLGQLCFGDFILDGELRALKKKTKVGMIIGLNSEDIKQFVITPTKEAKGNYISIPEFNIQRKLRRYAFLNRLKHASILFDRLINVKESIIDRIYEYYFGLYRNPLKQLITLKNINKLSYLKRDYKKL